MDMSCIKKCDKTDCAYNSSMLCHTMAITVGAHAECNTYVHASSRGGFDDVSGGVGSCQAMECKFNDRLECRAGEILVADHDKHADCATFQA